MATKLKYSLQDIAGVYPQKAGRKKHPLKEKYWGQQVRGMAIGHVDTKTGKVIYNELIDHPAIKKMLGENYGKAKSERDN